MTPPGQSVTPPTITVDKLKSLVGEEIGVSDWHVIDQQRIDAFAEVTQDRQYIHIDPEQASKTPFGGTIAHGFLTLSLLAPMAYEVTPAIMGSVMSVNYGFDKLRFLTPVRSGARVRGRFTLLSMKEKSPAQLQLDWNVIVEIEGEEKAALVAHWVTVQFFAV